MRGPRAALMQITIVVAMDEGRVIGYKNQMPWHLTQDLRRFKSITMGKPILMGRKTHASIGRVLPGRRNIVLTRDNTFASEGCDVVNSVEEAIQLVAHESDQLMIIGGAELYRQVIDQADVLEVTRIHDRFEGDTFFPEVDPSAWQSVTETPVEQDPVSGLRYSFVTYHRIP